MTVRMRFIAPDGRVTNAEAKAGDNLLRVAQAAGMPLEGTCEGQMACATCHVILPPEWFARLPPASEDEEDMLDLAPGACRTSRLACQVELREALDGLEVRVAGESYDTRR